MTSMMSPADVLAFLTGPPVRTAKLATTRVDGRPHVAPVWYDLDGSSMVFNTGADTVKGRNLRRDGRVAICVEDDRPPFTFVTIQGVAELSEDPDDLLRGRRASAAGTWGRTWPRSSAVATACPASCW